MKGDLPAREGWAKGGAPAPSCAFSIVPALLLAAAAAARAADPPTVEEFAARPQIEQAAISPDGRRIALVRTRGGRGVVVVVDREAGPPAPRVVLGEPDRFRISWCHWATDTRLLCGFRAMAEQNGEVYAVTRLAAVDADGRNQRVLIQNSDEAQGQFQDRIIHWQPGKPDTVLIEADEGLGRALPAGAQVYGNVGTHALPAVFELNVVTGAMTMRQRARDPIRHWTADRSGNVRIGWGLSGTTISYYARLDGESGWRRLSRFEVFSRDRHFEPIAISPDAPNMAYAFGEYEGRTALWLIDLTDRDDPTIVFQHPAVDVGNPILAADGRLLAVRYDTGYPMQYFADARMERELGSIHDLAPDLFNTLAGSSRDEKLLLIRSFSDRAPGSYLLLDTEAHRATRMGEAYPGRDTAALASMRAVSYTARDGTPIPAYLSTPPGVPPERLPLVVMPHGGPIARDTWGYFFLRQFLVSRGYAVLQMNFRGSSGYGQNWFFAAHQDWGGLTYDDVADGTRWAVRQGIADPARVCIVGWSFGGYLALLGAQRNPDLYRCAVDIAGVSDLQMLIEERRYTLSGAVARQQIGTDASKLKHDSPRQHAAEIQVPLLMMHGDMDAQVPFEQSDSMDAALKRAGRPHRFVVVRGADHQFSREQDRVLMLHEIENFLGRYLAATPGL